MYPLDGVDAGGVVKMGGQYNDIYSDLVNLSTVGVFPYLIDVLASVGY